MALVDYESRRGSRFASAFRSRLDAKTEHAAFIVAHVDFAAFLRDETRRLVRDA